MKKWFESNPSLFHELKSSIKKKYPTLVVLIEDGIVYIKGNLFLYSLDGREIDYYLIEIKIPENYPKSIPSVREVGSRIPRVIERHINPEKGNVCLFLPDERYKCYPPGSTIVDFIEGPVKNFFLWQTDFDVNSGKSSFSARGHNTLGRYEFYCEELKTKDIYVIKKFLDYITAKKLKKHWKCYCGGGKELRYCHINKLVDLRAKILRNDAKRSLVEIEKLKLQLERHILETSRNKCLVVMVMGSGINF